MDGVREVGSANSTTIGGLNERQDHYEICIVHGIKHLKGIR